MKRTASAVWNGDLLSGMGTISAPSGVLDSTTYSFKTRFEEGVTGTNPEELIAAAHAGCFSMALSHELAQGGHEPLSVATQATLQLEKVDGGFAITKIHLSTNAHLPGITEEEFERIARVAKDGCPVSKVLNADITLETRLKS